MECETCKYNRQIVDILMNEMPDDETINKLSEVFKVFGDGTRIRILWALFERELCVYDIAEATSMSQSAISHQLRILKNARLIKVRREKQHAYYSLDDEHVKRIIEQVMIHINE